MTRIISATPKAINEAANIIKDGGLVGMPTETVYGLAANARDGKAVARIFEAKGRPQFNPLIVHVNDIDAACEIAYMSERDRCVAQTYWPGPLTLILRRRDDSGLSDLVSAGLATVAVRVPSHKTARALIAACGVPIAAPSANRSGSLSTTTPAHVAQSLGGGVDLILADGVSEVGLESTVLDCTGDVPYVLRPGAITAEELSEVLGCKAVYDLGNKESGEVKSPGQLLRHYAPSTPVRLRAVDVEEGEALLTFGAAGFMGMRGSGEQAVVALPDGAVAHLSKDGDLYEAAANLFSMLHQLDGLGCKSIAVMDVPEHGVGVAINDRLRRASQI
jgi:L-threonylcarbamoyladenylate synthase